MRALAFSGVVACVLLVTGWASADPAPTPPKCSATDTRNESPLRVPPTGEVLYFRYCGRARATLRVNRGKLYRFRGGMCSRGWGPNVGRRTLIGVYVGMFSFGSAPPIGLAVHFHFPDTSAGATGVTRPGRITIEDSGIQVPGLPEMGGSGTVVVAKGLKSGTFKLLGRDASGPNGMPVTGTWTCGVSPTD